MLIRSWQSLVRKNWEGQGGDFRSTQLFLLFLLHPLCNLDVREDSIPPSREASCCCFLLREGKASRLTANSRAKGGDCTASRCMARPGAWAEAFVVLAAERSGYLPNKSLWRYLKIKTPTCSGKQEAAPRFGALEEGLGRASGSRGWAPGRGHAQRGVPATP